MDQPLTFKLARVAHGERNLIEGHEEATFQEEARKHREVLLPGVDLATAFAMQKKVLKPDQLRALVHIRQLSRGAVAFEQGLDLFVKGETLAAEDRQILYDRSNIESGFAVFMHENWPGLHHVVRYFELIEKNEAPDTPLLEWLVTAGAVPSAAVMQTVKRFTKPTTCGRHAFVLDPDDAARLKMAAEVRQELEAEDRARR